MLEILQWRHQHPTEALWLLPNDIRHPAVVAPSYREIDIRATAYRRNEKSRIDHLAVDAELIHVLEPQTDISHFSRCHRQLSSHIAARNNSSIHQPIIEGVLRVSRGDNLRLELPLGFQHVVPGGFVFDYMRIRINNSHRSFSRSRLAPHGSYLFFLLPAACCLLPFFLPFSCYLIQQLAVLVRETLPALLH